MNEYEQQAQDFATKYNLTMTATYLGHYSRLHGKWITANYRITLTRPGRKPYSFDFSTSINDSWSYTSNESILKKLPGLPVRFDLDKFFDSPECHRERAQLGRYTVTRTKKTPRLYDVLSCLQKYDPGIFEDFCMDFGYDSDSRKAEGIYFSVQKKWSSVAALFGDCLDELSEIN